jgi:hypothetical protein
LSVDFHLLTPPGHNYDVMAVRPYQGVADEPPDAADNGTQWRMRHVPTVKAAMDAVGDSGKPIWFTEFGWRVGTNTSTTQNWQRAVPEATQADYLARTVRMLANEFPYVTRVYWYRDRNTGTDPFMDAYGLINNDGTVRPALAQVPSVYAVAPSQPTASTQASTTPAISTSTPVPTPTTTSTSTPVPAPTVIGTATPTPTPTTTARPAKKKHR